MDTTLVLVADDDRPLLALLAEALELEGYRVLRAVDGREALAHLDQSTPFLLLLDWQMPVLDGQSVLCTLAGRTQRPQVIMMSGAVDFAAWCRRSSADACLAKPFTLGDLLDLVRRMDDVA